MIYNVQLDLEDQTEKGNEESINNMKANNTRGQGGTHRNKTVVTLGRRTKRITGWVAALGTPFLPFIDGTRHNVRREWLKWRYLGASGKVLEWIRPGVAVP